MEFKLTRASDSNFESVIEINNLKELLNLIGEDGVILSKLKRYERDKDDNVMVKDDGYRIKIYDDYVE